MVLGQKFRGLEVSKKRILILSFSYSHQTQNLLNKLLIGLGESDIEVLHENLIPERELRFPIGTISSTVYIMFQTFFRKRFPVKPLDPNVFGKWDLIIVAGPTWSYNPSGPILSMLDRDGEKLFHGQGVMPLISCRAYWRVHFWGLRSLLKKCGAKDVCLPIIFNHPNPEPWNTIGVFLKLAGKMPERGKGWFRKYYPKYGHSKQQIDTAIDVGRKLGQDVNSEKSFDEIQFEIPITVKKQ